MHTNRSFSPPVPPGTAREKQAMGKYALRGLLWAAAGFIASKAAILGALSPFGIAYAAAAKEKDAPAAMLGAALGYLVFAPAGFIKYILAMALLAALRWQGGLFTRIPRPFAAAGVLAVPSAILLVAAGGTIYDSLLALSEALLAGCATYFFARTISVLRLGLENMKQTDVFSIVITLCIAILSLVHLTIFHVSLGRILAGAAILLSAQFAREAGGSVAGVIGGLTAGVLGGQPILMGSYGFGGLLSGIFARVGRFPSAAVFILINVFVLLVMHPANMPAYLAELFFGAALFLLTPQEPVARLRACFQKNDGGEACRRMLSGRMEAMSGALRDVAGTTRRVNEEMTKLRQGDPSSVYHCAADKVCRSCRQKSLCWQERYGDTCGAMNCAMDALRQKGSLIGEDFPEWFQESCGRAGELAARISYHYNEYIEQQNLRRKVNQVRGVVTDQFEGMAMMIDAMGEELDNLVSRDARTEGKVKEYLQKQKIPAEDVCCMLDRDGCMRLEFDIPSHKRVRLDDAEAVVDLSEICEHPFDAPFCRTSPDGTTVTMMYTEKAVYAVKWGASQLGNADSRLCGDSYSYVDGRGGRVNFILSDGMGSGRNAAVDSAMTADLLGRLIEAGVSMDAALRLVNSALLVKVGDESLSTIDITGIDLYTGKAEFYKAGAAPTFLCKGGKSGYVESRSLPVGILSTVSFEKNAVTLREGDWIVMVTDGATASGNDWLLRELEQFAGDDPKELSERLAMQARERRIDGHEDDITVIAILLERVE